LFPIIIFNKNIYVLNHYNILNISKQHVVKILYTKKVLRIIKLFYKIGLINNYFIYKKKHFFYLKFSLFFYKNTVFFKNIKIISTSTKKHYITYKTLKLLNFFLKSSILILSTSLGILTHNQALKNKIGGLLLFLIN